jgi:hypothetical protein
MSTNKQLAIFVAILLAAIVGWLSGWAIAAQPNKNHPQYDEMRNAIMESAIEGKPVKNDKKASNNDIKLDSCLVRFRIQVKKVKYDSSMKAGFNSKNPLEYTYIKEDDAGTGGDAGGDASASAPTEGTKYAYVACGKVELNAWGIMLVVGISIVTFCVLGLIMAMMMKRSGQSGSSASAFFAMCGCEGSRDDYAIEFESESMF